MGGLLTTWFDSEGRRKDNDCTIAFTKSMQAAKHLQCLSRHKWVMWVTSIFFRFPWLERPETNKNMDWHSQSENKWIVISDHVSKGMNNRYSVHSALSDVDLQAGFITANSKLLILPFEFEIFFCGLCSGSYHQMSGAHGILIYIPGPREHIH